MNLFFIDEHSSSKYNGIGTFRDVLIPILGKRDNLEVTMISLNSDHQDLEIEEREWGVEMCLPFVDEGRWRDNGGLIWGLLAYYIPDSADNIFIFNHSPASSFIKAMKSVLPKSKIVFVIHDQGWCGPLFGDHRLLKRTLAPECKTFLPDSVNEHVRQYVEEEKEIYRLSDKVVALSESTESHLKNIYGVSAGKIVRIENGVHKASRRIRKNAARKRLGIRPEDQLLIFVARAVPHKGIIALIKTLKILVRRMPLLRCAIMGPQEGIIRFLRDVPDLAPFVILPGQRDAEELRRWYAAADVGVITSYTEQCSYAALEMMGAGLPVVSSDGNGLRDMFLDGENAFVAEIGDFRKLGGFAKRFSDKLESMFLASDKERAKMVTKNKNLLSNKYSAERMAEKYMELFNDLAAFGA